MKRLRTTLKSLESVGVAMDRVYENFLKMVYSLSRLIYTMVDNFKGIVYERDTESLFRITCKKRG